MPTPSTRSHWARLAPPVAAGTLLGLAVLIVPAWFQALVPERRIHEAEVALLVAAEPAYLATLTAALVGLAACITRIVRGRRRGRRRPAAARLALLLASVLLGGVLAEGVAGGWRAWAHRHPQFPPLPESFEHNDPGTLDVVIVGGSSAYGLPFEKWLSTGRIVAWKLGEVFPGRDVRLDVLAESGLTLEQMHLKLAYRRRRPDLLLIYSGHNEFTYRYRWSRSAPHYLDDLSRLARLRAWVGRNSSACALIREAVEAHGLGDPPPPEVTRSLVDVPACTPEERRERLDDFRRRLDAIVAHAVRTGTVPVILIPPGNDSGFEPNRSVLPPDTPGIIRAAFARRFRRARDLEDTDPAAAIAAYRALLAPYSGFAEAHYRLARLLHWAGELAEADRHYRAARDLDALTMRCPGDFQEACREVAARHPAAVLVDGQAAIAADSPGGILGDGHFLDAMHPNVRGHARLAQAVLDALHARRALGWPAATPSPALDPAACAAHFGLGKDGWIAACRWGATFFERTAYIRFDPSERLRWIERYREAARAIADGRDPDEVGLPGVGVRPID